MSRCGTSRRLAADNTVADIRQSAGGEIGKRRGAAADDEPEFAESFSILNIAVEGFEVGGRASCTC